MQHCGRVIHYDMGYMKYDYHSLRHTHATILIENGAPIKDVQYRLGHKSVQVTLDIYSHVTAKMQSQTLDILNNMGIDGEFDNDEFENITYSRDDHMIAIGQENRVRFTSRGT